LLPGKKPRPTSTNAFIINRYNINQFYSTVKKHLPQQDALPISTCLQMLHPTLVPGAFSRHSIISLAPLYQKSLPWI